MKTTAKVGGIIELEIQRADGTIENYGKHHNVIGGAAWPGDRVPYNHSGASVHGIVTFATQTTRGTSTLVGTYSQSGTTVTRVTGSESMNDISVGDLIEFGSGERAYKTANIGVSSCTVSKSQTVATTTLKRHKTATNGFGSNSTTGAVQSSSSGSYSTTTSYSNGVNTAVIAAPRAFSAVVTPYTLRCISAGIFMASQGAQYGSYYDLPVDINLLAGDVIIIKTWTYTITFTAYTPEAFAVSPIAGLTGSGRIQRLIPVTGPQTEGAGSPVISLIADANKLTPIPNMLAPGTAFINHSTLTEIEVIPAVQTSTPASHANNNTATSTFVGATNVGGTVKQIIWGDITRAFGIIEFDTPVVIPNNKAIIIHSSQTMEVELP